MNADCFLTALETGDPPGPNSPHSLSRKLDDRVSLWLPLLRLSHSAVEYEPARGILATPLGV